MKRWIAEEPAAAVVIGLLVALGALGPEDPEGPLAFALWALLLLGIFVMAAGATAAFESWRSRA